MIECACHVSAPAEDLFQLTQNYALRLEWDPFPESYKFINGDSVCKGLKLVVTDKAGREMTVEYVSYKPPKVAAVKMISGPWYIKKFAGSWSFKELDSNQTKVVFKYNIVGYPNFSSPILRKVFEYNASKRLFALKHYVEKAQFSI